MINIALPKGRLGDDVYAIFASCGYDCDGMTEESRRLVFENDRVRYFWVKPTDVPVYVERGVADIGVAGSDTLAEYEPDVYELLDLGVGKCFLAVAAMRGFTDTRRGELRVATKFAHVAHTHFERQNREIDVIHLNGSIELAPLLGLSDVIVDIVSTGTTLRENGLEVVERITDVSARLIANKVGYKFKHSEIGGMLSAVRGVLK